MQPVARSRGHQGKNLSDNYTQQYPFLVGGGEASNPSEALRMFEAGQKVSLLFTDVVMPQMSGRDLADRARKHQPDLKVLYSTGYTRNAIVHNGVLDAGSSLLTKPFSIDELAVKVRKILDE